MTPERKAEILFWTDVLLRLLVSAAIILGMVLFANFLADVRRGMEQDRLQDQAMLSYHLKALKDHEEVMERLRR